MPTSIELDHLRPFKAALVARFEEGEDTVDARKILLRLRKELGVTSTTGPRQAISAGHEGDPVDIAFVHYEDRRPVMWSKEPLMDRSNYLALVIRVDRWVAIHVTETSRKKTVTKALRSGKLGPLEVAKPGQLKAAFVKGRARTLWLRGTHRRTDHKADTKVLGGRDLAPTLDPLGDQSYRYTAVRCEPQNDSIGEVMGLAVDDSRIWVSPSTDRADFEMTMIAMLQTLAASEGTSLEPLPVLAEAQRDLEGVDSPYELAITPPELLIATPVLDAPRAEEIAEMEQLAFGTAFDVTSSSGTSLTATVLRRGEEIGSVDISFSTAGEEVMVGLDGYAATGFEEEFSVVRDQLRDPESFTVYFDSGHSIQGGQVFSMRYRDQPFQGWTWAEFSENWELTREKPQGGLAAIGGEDRSLFSWVHGQWPSGAGQSGARGWLACDDRPGETADFLHLDQSGEVPVLTLIHAKGARSGDEGRGISVGAYEVVCSQAVKNLRHLDMVLSAKQLIGSTFPAELELLAWEDGEQRTREQFVEQLDALSASAARRVVILQPHVREGLVGEIRADPEHGQLLRLRQLDTLLNGVAADCRSVGAELLVIGAK